MGVTKTGPDMILSPSSKDYDLKMVIIHERFIKNRYTHKFTVVSIWTNDEWDDKYKCRMHDLPSESFLGDTCHTCYIPWFNFFAPNDQNHRCNQMN